MKAPSRAVFLPLLACAALTGACRETNPFAIIPAQVVAGSAQVWELSLEGFPNTFDLPSGQRFILGATPVSSTVGSFVLDARADGTLVFVPYSAAVPGFAAVRTGIQDLGARSFESVQAAPAGGYGAPTDSLGVPVVAGHTYAFRMSSPFGGVVALNYAKVHVLEVGQQVAGDPRSRFIRFQWAYQNRPGERNLAVPEGPV